MSRSANVPLPQLPPLRKLGETSRKDAWWLPSLMTFLGLGAFIVYSTWAALQGVNYFVPGTHYLSPMYSPVIFDSWKLGQGAAYIPSGHAWFGQWPAWMPTHALIPLFAITPAFLILWAPGGFRFTCYYYRGAYYKAFWGDPVSCAVGEPGFRGKNYRGEQKFPLIFQNIHRYFFYIAVIFIGLLSYDAVMSYIFTSTDAAGEHHSSFGIGIGSIILTLNPIFLGCYTFGCHVFRHLIGGKKDALSELGAQKKAYDCVSCLNRRHMMWAWISLFWVGFTDGYVRLVASGVWHDYRLF